jgi:DNA-binding NarL/FixJ family response regulator
MEVSDVVLLADPDTDARHQLGCVLEGAGFRVLEAVDGEEALAKARADRPAAAILEVPLGTLSGYEVCRALKTEFGPDLAVMFLSGVRTESYDRVAGLLVGADDYVVKPPAPDEVLARLRNLIRRVRLVGSTASGRLTRREHEVLALLSEGLKWGEIAEHLVISPKTVATHVENIRRKLGVSSRAEAVAAAYRDEILPPPGIRTVV